MRERDKIAEALVRAADIIEKRPIAGEVSVIDVDFSDVPAVPLPAKMPYGIRPGHYVLDESDMADEGGAVYATSAEQIVAHTERPERHPVMDTSLDVEAAEAWAREGIDPKRLYTIKGGISMWDVLAGLAWGVIVNSMIESGAGQPVYPRNPNIAPNLPRKKHARKSEYRRKSSGNITTTDVITLNGPITNALMARNDGAIEAASYFDDEARKVNTGSGGHAMLDVRASEETQINAPYREYRLSDRDRFWLDPLYTLAINEGRHTIEGSEILKLRGYSNPFAPSSAATMADALKSIEKATATRIAIDVTHEKRDKRKNNATLAQSIRLQPVVNATIDLDSYEGEGGPIKDFTINLQTHDPIESLPLAQYEKNREMLTTVSAQDFDFKGIKLTADDRQMWAYVLRIINSKKLSDSILFETMWRNLEIEEPKVSPYAYVNRKGEPLDMPLKDGGKPVDPKDAPRATEEQRRARLKKSIKNQHDRMLKKLEKMLDAKKGELFKGWSYHKDNAGRIDGVKVARAKN